MPDSTHSPTDAPAPEGDREVLMVPADRVLASATSMHDLAALPAEQVPIVVVLRAARLLYDDAAIMVDAASSTARHSGYTWDQIRDELGIPPLTQAERHQP